MTGEVKMDTRTKSNTKICAFTSYPTSNESFKTSSLKNLPPLQTRLLHFSPLQWEWISIVVQVYESLWAFTSYLGFINLPCAGLGTRKELWRKLELQICAICSLVLPAPVELLTDLRKVSKWPETPTWAFSLLKVPTSTSKIKNILKHYAQLEFKHGK